MEKRDIHISRMIVYSPVIFIVIAMFFMSFFVQSKLELALHVLMSITLSLVVYFVAKKIVREIETYKQEIASQSNELQEKNETLLKVLYTDLLTDLPNKKSLSDAIEKVNFPKVTIFDIDSFRNINEYYGNEAGDYILLDLKNVLEWYIQDSKIKLYRIGADEFAFLEDEGLDIEEYETMVIELVELLKAREVKVPNQEEYIEVHVTIGSSLESEDVLAKAYMALQYAKTTQKDYAFYMQNLDTKEAYANQVKWANFIKNAIKKDEVVPYFQPIFNTKGEIRKYECLARIVTQDKAVSPGMFMETSKSVKQYPLMAKVLIDKAFQKIVNTDISVSINLLARDMSDSDVSNYLLDKIKEYDVAKQVILEILEDENIDSLERVDNYLQRVRRMGVRIAIDDFGTGYSNFSYLLKLKPNYIKIDGSLIKNIDTDENSLAIVSAILAFAKRIGIKTIAEYIHSKEVYEKCLELGIDEFQGFYLGKPSSELVH